MTSNLPANITVTDMSKMADAVAKSGLFGIKKPEEAMALMLIAQAEGSHPAIAIRDYHIIQGKPALKADAMLARFQQAGGKIEWLALKDDRVAAKFSHPAGGTAEIDWDMKRAQAAQLGGKDMWKKFPRQMLRARVISEGIRTVFPGVIVGSYTPEEVQDFDDKPAAPAARAAAPQPQQGGQVIEGKVVEVQQSVAAQPQDLPKGAFSMAGEPDPDNPFRTGDERRQWMIDVKAYLEAATTRDEFDEWMAQYAANLKYLGMSQQKAMNELINMQRAKIEGRDLDRQAQQKSH